MVRAMQAGALAFAGAPNSTPDQHNDEETFCVCNRVSFGEMIACESETCRVEWFHFACVGLSSDTEITGKWFCRACASTAPNADGVQIVTIDSKTSDDEVALRDPPHRNQTAILYLPPTTRQNVNCMTENALCAATLAAAAAAPEPYPVFAFDENGNELVDEPPVFVVPLRRRLTVPRGILGAYDILTRMDEPSPEVSEAEEDRDGEERPGVVKNEKWSDVGDAKGGVKIRGENFQKTATKTYDLRSPSATRAAVQKHASLTCARADGISTVVLVRDLYPGDAVRDASVLLERIGADGKTQALRLREREKKLGLVQLMKRKRGGGPGRGGAGGRGRGRGRGRGVRASSSDPNAYSTEYQRGSRERAAGERGISRNVSGDAGDGADENAGDEEGDASEYDEIGADEDIAYTESGDSGSR